MTRTVCKQALLKLGESREDRLRRVTLQVNQDDVVFALQVSIDGKHHLNFLSSTVYYFSPSQDKKCAASYLPSVELM